MARAVALVRTVTLTLLGTISLIDLASALINGEMPTAHQRQIDALLRD